MPRPTLCLAVLLLSAVAGHAQQQAPAVDSGKGPQNTSGRTAIPEKIAPPLQPRQPAAPDTTANRNDLAPDLRESNPKALPGTAGPAADERQQKK
jgi:hypothetical protein